MAERKRYFQYSLSPSKPIPNRSLKQYKVLVGNEQIEDQLSPEVEETLQTIYATSSSHCKDGGHESYQYEDVASSSQDSLWGKTLYKI